MKRGDPRMQAKRARRIVVKVGSSTLTRGGALRPRKFTELAEQITALVDQRRVVDGAEGERDLGLVHRRRRPDGVGDGLQPRAEPGRRHQRRGRRRLEQRHPYPGGL